MKDIRPIRWQKDERRVELLEQRDLPEKETWLTLTKHTEMADAITDMAIRGAPAIGTAAAFGVALGVQEAEGLEGEALDAHFESVCKTLAESRPTYVLELPQKEGDADAFEHWTCELGKFRRHLESQFGVEITDEKIREATRLMNRERHLRRELAALMKTDCPPLTGRQLLDFKSTISCIPADLDNVGTGRIEAENDIVCGC